MLLSIVTMLSTVGAIHSWFQVQRTCNHVECQRHDTYIKYCSFRVSDASHLQHAYEIKDFGSTMFRIDRFVTMLSNEVAIHNTRFNTFSWFRCWKHRNHVEHHRCDTFVFPNFEEICKHVEQRSCDTYFVYTKNFQSYSIRRLTILWLKKVIVK